jgi:hypothetical protein
LGRPTIVGGLLPQNGSTADVALLLVIQADRFSAAEEVPGDSP